MSAPKTSFIIPVDGSVPSQHATQYVIDAIKNGQQADVHLLNVQPPVSGSVSHTIGKETVDSYHREEAEKALAAPKALLDSAGIPYKLHIGVGDPGDIIPEAEMQPDRHGQPRTRCDLRARARVGRVERVEAYDGAGHSGEMRVRLVFRIP